MRITILAVGQRQPAWADAAVKDYLARLPAGFKVELKQVKAERRSGNLPLPRMLGAEAARIRAAVPAGALLLALDEKGKEWTTRQLADHLQRWRDAAEDIAFAIGGADGLDPELKRDARMVLRLSSLTLPHALARVVLAEQLYRAWSLLAGHPYHRA
ncbi:MAG TPA: 23S rRNA (pseudouridine(1915)-N(3))-methyltransferase RlmH [Burkholderiaceae bacterium]|nr:23S rRNA (pseudouridine(1915)-N(3))-methyltransferase RlmH [Burkholderiaceae bacterium]